MTAEVADILDRTAAVLASKGAAAASTLCSAMATAVTQPGGDQVLRAWRRSLLSALVNDEQQALDSAFTKIVQAALAKSADIVQLRKK